MDTKKLRQKILDLAIHGKLVPQDPNDEPASVLLERIRSEKERLIKEGKIKRSRKTTKTSDATCDEQEVPFEVPSGWVWCLLEDLAYVAAGSTPNKDAFVAKGIPYIKMYNLRMQKIDFDFHPQYIKREIHEGKLYRSRTEIGDLLMNIVGPPLGKLAVIPSTLPEGNFNQAAVLIRPYHHKELLVKYLFYYLSEMSEINSISTKGSAGQVNISLTQSQNMRIPLPPLAEQQRIVEEIECWFKLIDIIEQGKADLQTTIKQAKNKILDLAIHGKLVPQDPNDEPASKLLKRINPKAEITCDNGHYPKLPKGWAMCRLSNVCKIYSGFAFSSNDYRTEGIPLIRISNIKNNTIDLSECVFIKSTIDDRFIISRGDLLIAMSGATTGKMGIYENDNIAYLNQRVGNIKVLSDTLLLEYRNLYMLSKVDDILKIAYGGAQPNISASAIENLNIMLPPQSEQKRIVSKIEDLFGFIKTIEESL